MTPVASAVRAESLDARFLNGLRQRQLYPLAEAYCRNRLSRTPNNEAAQAELTVELIRTLGTHAANSKSDERDPLWADARAVAAAFGRQSPPHPRAILVRLQDALTPLA